MDRLTAVSLALAAAALALLGSWWLDGQPVNLRAGGTLPLQCVSYAPSSGYPAPPGPVTREHIRRDLELIARRFRCVRTYTVAHGLDQVPSVARELGLEVLLGAWIGGDPAQNERELALAIEAARRDRDAIEAIVVGNEVLLRHELSEDQLAPLIERVARDTGLAVTYADVWGYWMSHRSLARSVSFVTVHILPYWDDHPAGIDAVIARVEQIYSDLRAYFPGKHVLVGETGWPSYGKPRGELEPSRVNQARYLREFTALAERREIPYNLIEAFDQPWKRAHEGTVGAYWGLYDARGREKFSWSGPVVEAPHARAVVLASAALGALGALAGVLLLKRRRGRGAVVVASSAILAVAIGAHQVEYLHAASVTWIDWTASLLVVVAGWTAFFLACRGALSGAFCHDSIPRALALLLLLGSAYACAGLAVAGRHRDFPVWLFLPAVLALAAAAWMDPLGRARILVRRRAIEETIIAFWLVSAGAAIPLVERFGNQLSIAWGLSSLALGLSVLLPLALQARQDQRASHDADD
jgi:exo-beta-1,3-glucanase (GH17 family)